MENAARGMGGSSLGSSSDDPWGSACFPGPAVLDELHVQQVSLQQQLPGQGRLQSPSPQQLDSMVLVVPPSSGNSGFCAKCEFCAKCSCWLGLLDPRRSLQRV